jgi:hypothetical protein
MKGWGGLLGLRSSILILLVCFASYKYMLLSFLIKTFKYSYLLGSAKHRTTIECCAEHVLIVEELQRYSR